MNRHTQNNKSEYFVNIKKLNSKKAILCAQINAPLFYCLCKNEILYLPLENFS